MLLFSLQALALKRGKRLDPRRVEAIRRRRLARLVRFAVGRSAFYRDKYRGIDPDSVRLEDLPVTTKAELMANFDRAVTDPAVKRADLERFMDDPDNARKLFLGRYVASHTSGSQGQSLLMLQDPAQVALGFALQIGRGYNGRVNPVEVAKRFITPARLAVVSLKAGYFPSAVQFLHMPEAAKRLVNVGMFSQTDPDLVARLNDFRPQVLTGYAGVLEMLALEAEAGNLRLGPGLQQVVNNSETLTDRARAHIARAFGLHVMNNYATGECPFLCNGCPTDEGAHVNADLAALEVVDQDGRPVPPGTPGRKVYVTNLFNTVQPFLRYEVGDVVTMADGPCRCGSRLPRVLRVDGRAADEIVVGEGGRRRLAPVIFVNAFEFSRDIRDWQVELADTGRMVVRFEPLPGATPDLERARTALRREMEAYEFHDIPVDFEIVPRLDPDPRTGKFRRIIHPAARQAVPGTHAGAERGVSAER